MGILNVTPDSFSDGGLHLSPGDAVRRAFAMIDEGAAVIDVGPESTRPGAEPVSDDKQIARAIPVIERIRERHRTITLSIDTRSANVASAAINAGANMINDVSALRDDSEMAALTADTGVSVVLMHMRGTPADMQQGGGPRYDDVVGEVTDFLRECRAHAIACGIRADRIIFDPGLGFGKRVEHNLTLLRRLDHFAKLGQPLLVGASRKSFIGHLARCERSVRSSGRAHAEGSGTVGEASSKRLGGSLACAVLAALAGAAIVRVHDVAQTVEAIKLTRAIHHPEFTRPPRDS